MSPQNAVFLVMEFLEHDVKALMETMTQPFLGVRVCLCVMVFSSRALTLRTRRGPGGSQDSDAAAALGHQPPAQPLDHPSCVASVGLWRCVFCFFLNAPQRGKQGTSSPPTCS